MTENATIDQVRELCDKVHAAEARARASESLMMYLTGFYGDKFKTMLHTAAACGVADVAETARLMIDKVTPSCTCRTFREQSSCLHV